MIRIRRLPLTEPPRSRMADCSCEIVLAEEPEVRARQLWKHSTVRRHVQAGVDAAYRRKYGRYPSIVEHLLTPAARESTLRLVHR